ncbi:MAG: metalloregulator ArsR/SmtB family transcription factor [Armatimonadota bacterium]|nr:metalloregulator ArsR/SmtB family transcription factor [Armatimonadota bacterium]
MKTNREFKDAIYEQFARISKALSSPKRLELLDLLCQGERTVEVLAKAAGLSVANASRHLQILRAARLVQAEKQGLFVIYRLADLQVCDLLSAIRLLAEARLAEIEQITRQFMQSHPDLEPVDRETLRERVLSGAVTLLDVRPKEEYLAGHIPGALCVPLEELEGRLDGLPRDQEIVAYCRGPYCVLAVEAVERLKARGFNAHRMEDGVVEWRSLGLPVEETVVAAESADMNRQA